MTFKVVLTFFVVFLVSDGQSLKLKECLVHGVNPSMRTLGNTLVIVVKELKNI